MTDHIVIDIAGKSYTVWQPKAAQVFATDGSTRVSVVYHYRSMRDGQQYGPVRWASTTAASNTGIGPKLIAAAAESFGVDHDQMITEFNREGI